MGRNKSVVMNFRQVVISATTEIIGSWWDVGVGGAATTAKDAYALSFFLIFDFLADYFDRSGDFLPAGEGVVRAFPALALVSSVFSSIITSA